VRGVERRLLIPGVLTQNVLNQYINMLKVLQILDPHGFIFERVTHPIKNYLLKRNDTLRCIISFLTEDVENYSKLTKEVVKIPSKEYIEEADSDEDENAAEKW
jgi:anaphase-promoting complex subunit 2